jgi:hypothetical protein
MLAGAGACAGASLEVNGFVVEEDAYKEDLNVLGARASVEMGCSRDQLAFELIAVHDDAGPDMPQSFAVTGCDVVAVYSRLSATGASGTFLGAWELESIRGKGEATQQPANANPDGTQGGACYGNGTCNDGLACVDGTCLAEG